MSELTRRYARALYLVSPDEAALRETAGALMGDAALWEALISPAVEPAEKVRVLERLPFLSGPLLRFCCLLAEKWRTGCSDRYLTALAISWFRMNRTHFSSE